MSNEHLSQVGPSALDDDGPLDPSVFFGLFDDLVDGAGTEPAPDEVPANGADHGDQPDGMNGHVVVVETYRDGDVEDGDSEDGDSDLESAHGDVEDGDSEGGDSVAETAVGGDGDRDERDRDASKPRPATVSWWSTAPDEGPSNRRAATVASPPPIPPGAERTDARRGADIFASDGPTATAEAPANGVPPTVTFTPVVNDQPVDRAGIDALRFTVPSIDNAVDRLDGRARDTTDGTPPAIEGSGGGTMAKATLATITIGLLAGLVVAFVLSLTSPDRALDDSAAGDPAGSTIDATLTGLARAVATGTRPTTDLLAEEFATALAPAITDRIDLTSLRFEPGTTDLDERSTAVAAELGALLVDQPAVPLTIAVRTYTESTPADNLALSVSQAEALAAALVTAGASPEQIRTRGLGAAPLSRAQPVPNFVALTPQFGDRRFDEVLGGHSPFALGVPATAGDGAWALRPDGLLTIGELADALSAFGDAEVGAAGYSFLPPSEVGIRSEADTAASELADFLVAAYGVDSERITTIIPGAAVFVPTPEHGNHIWVQVGPASQGAFDVASIDPDAITFEPGSAELDVAGMATVRALADILTTGGATIVVDVRSYGSADATADQALSEARRDSLTRALTAAGVAPEQLRMYASGASSYLLDDGGSAITITVAP